MAGKTLPYWNHNAAYYPWIAAQTKRCGRILDVGCGDGTLAHYLADDARTVVGIDPFKDGIARAKEKQTDADVRFEVCSFEAYEGADGSFDAVIFAASLHHLDAKAAIQKAVRLLDADGVLIVVGLAKPETVGEKLLDAARCIPSLVISKLHGMKDTEALNIPVSYSFDTMRQIRAIADEMLPGASARQALHYRYLLKWKKSPQRIDK